MFVTLTSDFGWESEGPGVMEATILGICPQAKVVHLSHYVTPFNILEGARQMECVTTIPKGIHVCVVDPGVGSSRLGLVLDVPPLGFLVGPDNGVLMAAVRRVGGLRAARSIDNPQLLRHPVSSVFHGRDVFASVAGHLASGVEFEKVGELRDSTSLVAAPYGDAVFEQERIRAVVIHINRYGNCILNIPEGEIFSLVQSKMRYNLLVNEVIAGEVLAAPTFSSVNLGSPILYPDSYGRVALALNQGDAAKAFGLHLEDELELITED